MPTYPQPAGEAGTSSMADPDAPAVDEVSQAVKDINPTTIANEPDDIKADPKADIQ